MEPFEALYGRKCRTPLCWSEIDEALIIGPELIQETTEKVRRIQEHIKTAQSRQKSYADQRRGPLEFQVGDKVFLKVFLIKGVRRFNIRGKLSPRYIRPYEIVKKLNPVAYQLNPPTALEYVHNVFHISQLRKHVPNPNHIIELEPIELAEDLMYEEHPIQILDRRVKQLRNKSIPLVKVLWASHASSEAIWETEEDMKNKYPYLFEVSPSVSRTKLILRGEGCNGPP